MTLDSTTNETTRPELPAPLAASLREALLRAEAYIHSRRSAEGGYCFYRSDLVDEPNLHDTYHAVAALKTLRGNVPDVDGLVRFLNGNYLYGPNYLYWYALSFDVLGLTSRVDAAHVERIRRLEIAPADQTSISGRRTWLESAHRIVTLKKLFGCLDDHPDIVQVLASISIDGGFGAGGVANLWDTRLCIAILLALGRAADAQKAAAYILDQQVPPFGFSVTVGSLMASLEVAHAGVKCCAMLGLPIKYPDQVLSLILSCQMTDGGFSRTPVALPDLELTHHAIETAALVAPELVDSLKKSAPEISSAESPGATS